jgi:hypothetical protein
MCKYVDGNWLDLAMVYSMCSTGAVPDGEEPLDNMQFDEAAEKTHHRHH